ncbi:oligopeptide/dipeptide ABC transporter ATP-binding protein [Pseudooceanicola albus]|nr:ABC transporter ATP-binding protein [Pseudooceanicola albus]
MDILEVNDLTKHFTVRGSERPLVAVGGVSFTVKAGETLGLVGESGSGKTTVGRMIMGLESATSGSVVFDGFALEGLERGGRRRLARDIQIVFQDPADSLDPRHDILRLVAQPLTLQNLPRQARDQKVARALLRCGLPLEVLHRYPHELSAGAQQKVALARAIVGDPRFLVLDEPTSSLDVKAREELLKILRQLQKDSNLATIFVSHDLTAIRGIADTLAVMYLGEVVEYGRTADLFANPRHPYTRALLASVPVPDPERPRPERLRLSGEIPSPINLPEGCYLRGRCPRAEAVCARLHPTLSPARDAPQKVACLLEQADRP